MRARPIRAMILCAAFSIACGEASVLDPIDHVSPEPPTETPTADPATPRGLRRLWIEGVFEMTTRITAFDPERGEDLAGYQYAGILRFERDLRYGPGIGGTFSDLHGILANGEKDAWERSGHITSYFRDREVVIELVDDSFSFSLIPFGMAREGPALRVHGRFGTGGHIAGDFTVREDHPDVGRLRGVVHSGGLPLVDVQVVLRDPSGIGSSATGPSGDYEFRGWPGAYTLWAIPPLGLTCGDVTVVMMEAGESTTQDISCSAIEGAWIISYRLNDTWSCVYGESIEQTAIFTLDGPTLAATINPFGNPDVYAPASVTMRGPFDRLTGRYEAASPPILVSLGIGYDPDPLVETWRVQFSGPSSIDSPAIMEGIATLSSNKYGTCDFRITGQGPPF
jgi:hypothetical protein